MISIKPSETEEQTLFPIRNLISVLDPKNVLITLASIINWVSLSSFMLKYYDTTCGRPNLPLRLLIGLTILKYLYNLSDEMVVQAWSENPYFQAFTGQTYFITEIPCHPSELSKFRTRIGEEGCEMIFAESVRIHGKSALEDEVIGDTTVQEKYTKFPTDLRLATDVIKVSLRIAKHFNIKLRRSYEKENKKLIDRLNFSKGKMKKNESKSALKRIRTNAGAILRDIGRKLPPHVMEDDGVKKFFADAHKAITQDKNSKDKIYSIFEPQVKCIAKGKAEKKYEFGNKVSIVTGKNNGIILSAIGFNSNPYDGDTIAPALKQMNKLHGGYVPSVFIGDRGYRGRRLVDGVSVVTPYDQKNNDCSDPKKVSLIRSRCRRRSSIEPNIGHIKQDHRGGRNMLKGVLGDTINPILAAASYNFKKYVNKSKEAVSNILVIGKSKSRALRCFPFFRPTEESLFDKLVPQPTQ
jgi:IS5 family transposase